MKNFAVLVGGVLLATKTLAGQALITVEDFYGNTATLMSSPCSGARDVYEGYVRGEDQRLRYLCWFPMDNGVYIIDKGTKRGTFLIPGKMPPKKSPDLANLYQ